MEAHPNRNVYIGDKRHFRPFERNSRHVCRIVVAKFSFQQLLQRSRLPIVVGQHRVRIG